MKVAFDSVVLGAWLHPEAKYPATAHRIPERLAYLVKTLEEKRSTLLVPTPALAEFLVLAENEAPAYLKRLARNRAIEIVPFDEKAAVEAAEAEILALQAGDSKAGATGPRQKIKVDRQIVAIAKVRQVDCLYSEDSDVAKIAVPMGVTVQGLSQIPLPPEDAQQPLFPGESSD